MEASNPEDSLEDLSISSDLSPFPLRRGVASPVPVDAILTASPRFSELLDRANAENAEYRTEFDIESRLLNAQLVGAANLNLSGKKFNKAQLVLAENRLRLGLINKQRLLSNLSQEPFTPAIRHLANLIPPRRNLEGHMVLDEDTDGFLSFVQVYAIALAAYDIILKEYEERNDLKSHQTLSRAYLRVIEAKGRVRFQVHFCFEN